MFDVVILEDDALLRLALVEALESEGFVVRDSASSSEALTILEEAEMACVLVADCELGHPDEPDGFTVAARTLVKHLELVVVYASAHSDLLADRILSPRERILPKPYTPDQLVELVLDILGPRSANGAIGRWS